jgi:hypothetical protein
MFVPPSAAMSTARPYMCADTLPDVVNSRWPETSAETFTPPIELAMYSMTISTRASTRPFSMSLRPAG